MRYFIFLFLPVCLFSQNIKGKVYDSESTAKGVKVLNISNQSKTYTDINGNFTIVASVSGTLSFESLFHLKKNVKIKEGDFDKIVVFELKKKINKLGRVNTKRKSWIF